MRRISSAWVHRFRSQRRPTGTRSAPPGLCEPRACSGPREARCPRHEHEPAHRAPPASPRAGWQCPGTRHAGVHGDERVRGRILRSPAHPRTKSEGEPTGGRRSGSFVQTGIAAFSMSVMKFTEVDRRDTKAGYRGHGATPTPVSRPLFPRGSHGDTQSRRVSPGDSSRLRMSGAPN